MKDVKPELADIEARLFAVEVTVRLLFGRQHPEIVNAMRDGIDDILGRLPQPSDREMVIRFRHAALELLKQP